MNILIIGATGFIGKEVVNQLALEDVSLTLLVRNKLKAAPLVEIAPSKIKLVKGDLTEPNLGLDQTEKDIVLDCDMILHCGGPMDITLSKEIAKNAFLEGSKRVMDLAKEIHYKKGLKKFIHVVGYMSPFTDNSSSWKNIDVFKEIHPDLIDMPPYEQMKFLADIYVRQEAKKNGISLAVINPPTVIGDYQTGCMEQQEGFGLFIKIIRNGFLPVIPGGKNYRLPLINKNIVAQFIVKAIFNESKKEMTYTLVSDRELDNDIHDLVSMITESMNMKTPRLSVPLWLLTHFMTLGGSRLTGIPKNSLDFLTAKEFDNQLTKNDFNPELVKEIPASNIPLSIADIDFRLTYSEEKITPFIRISIGGITTYQLHGKSQPIILFHGLLSDGTDLFKLSMMLNKKTGRGIIIADLPGFGRSPFIKDKNILTPYMEMILSIKEKVPEGSIFVGHSFGAALLLEASNRNFFAQTDKIILLQPPINKIVAEPGTWISKILLRHMSDKQLSDYFNKAGLILSNENTHYDYLNRVKKSFNSPRILNTTLQLNKVLKKMNLQEKMNQSCYTIWGTKDKSYAAPIKNNLVTTLPFGHYFPISNPIETANIIAQIIGD